MEKNKKVLVVTSDLPDSNSQTNITLKNIWKQWDKKNLLFYVINKSKQKNYNNSKEYLFKSKLGLRVLLNKRNNSIGNSNNNTKKAKLCFFRKIKQLIYAIIDCSPLLLKRKESKKILSFSPDYIYTFGSSITLLKTSIKIAKKNNAKIIIHFLDNWAEVIQWEENFFVKWYSKKIKKYLKKAYEYSSFCLTISEKMAYDYENKTKIKHYPLMNCIDISKWYCDNKEINFNNINIVYAGSLYLERDITLVQISEILERVIRETGVNCHFNVYAINANKTYIEKVEKRFSFVKFYLPVKNEEIKKVYDNSDLLLLVEGINSSKVIEKFTKYSLSTKVAEYLASNRLILYVGEKDRTLPEYLQNNNCALVAYNNEEIYKAIKKFLFDNNQLLINNALKLVNKNHNILNLNKKINIILNGEYDENN